MCGLMKGLVRFVSAIDRSSRLKSLAIHASRNQPEARHVKAQHAMLGERSINARVPAGRHLAYSLLNSIPLELHSDQQFNCHHERGFRERICCSWEFSSCTPAADPSLRIDGFVASNAFTAETSG
jgi:hypothetical protein